MKKGPSKGPFFWAVSRQGAERRLTTSWAVPVAGSAYRLGVRRGAMRHGAWCGVDGPYDVITLPDGLSGPIDRFCALTPPYPLSRIPETSPPQIRKSVPVFIIYETFILGIVNMLHFKVFSIFQETQIQKLKILQISQKNFLKIFLTLGVSAFFSVPSSRFKKTMSL